MAPPATGELWVKQARVVSWSDVGDREAALVQRCAAGDEDAFSYESWLGPDENEGPRGKSGHDHFSNFISCVRSRKAADLHAPIEEGHISCALVHLANASYRLGRELRFDPETEQVIGDDEANRLLADGDRGYRPPFVVPDTV